MTSSPAPQALPRRQILIGDALTRLHQFPDGQIDCIVTSPPYFGLRSYMPDAVKLRGDIDPEKLASVLKELDSLGISPCAHTSV